MIESYHRTLRFLRQFARARQTGDEYEILIDGEGAPPRAATLYAPKSAHRARSGWVLLHGITVPGRHHLALRRMARALAAAGDVVVVPEVPRWTALEVTSREAGPAVQAGLSVLAGRHGVDPSRVGIMGFSVAATWALAFAARSDHIAVVVGVGGYGALQPLLRAMVVGEYEWDGVTGSYIPDPYGRWIMGSTLLPLLDGETYGRLDERRAAARALGELARTAGRHGAYAGQAVYDRLIDQLRDSVPPGARSAWDLLTPKSGHRPEDAVAARALADAMADAARRAEPELEPRGRLEGLHCPVLLLHGAGDRLVPYTETLRLAEEVPPQWLRELRVTRLLGHTKRSEAAHLWNPLVVGREATAFAAFIHGVLKSVREP